MTNHERSYAAPRTFTDEHIEFWAAVYLANPFVGAAAVSFETFLLAPMDILLALAQKRGTAGLLPEQRVARANAWRTICRLSMDDDFAFVAALERRGLHCANGRWIEKLKHRAWPKHRGPRKYDLLEF